MRTIVTNYLDRQQSRMELTKIHVLKYAMKYYVYLWNKKKFRPTLYSGCAILFLKFFERLV